MSGAAMPEQITKVAVITGAARGIGLTTAKKFLSQGWRVALLDIDGQTLLQAAGALSPAVNVMALTCDVADPE